jgi:hypothetical protein
MKNNFCSFLFFKKLNMTHDTLNFKIIIFSKNDTLQVRSFGLWAFTPFIPLCPKPKTENKFMIIE